MINKRNEKNTSKEKKEIKNETTTTSDLKEMYPDAYCDASGCTNYPSNTYEMKSRRVSSKRVKEETHTMMYCDECYDKIINGELIPRVRRNFNERSTDNPMPSYSNSNNRRRKYF